MPGRGGDKCGHCGDHYRLWIILLVITICSVHVVSKCTEQSMCSFMFSEGECENDPEYMLQECPKSCKNPCLCPGISSDTACDCLVRAKEGYCEDPAAMADCKSTCTQVNHDSCPLLPIPDDPNAQLSTWSSNYLTTVTEICNKGYQPVEPEDQGKKVCSSGGKWVTDTYNGAPVECAPVDCGPPPASDNTFSVAQTTTFGSTADYSCDKGYTPLQGQRTLTCNASGLWEGDILTCTKVDCGQPPSAPNASFKVGSTSTGGKTTYSCNTGYRHVGGDTSLSCSSLGAWQGTAIVCAEVDCGPPPQPSNSQVVVVNTTYGHTANYTCDYGYVFVHGQTMLTCDAKGTWGTDPPLCSKVSCGPPPPVANSTVTSNGASYGDMANYSCQTGYIYVSGDTTLTCEATGKWEGSLISCQKISCGPPPPIASSAVTSNGTSYGDMANYTCQTGYIYLSGNTTLTCGATGKWEGSLVSCQKISCGPPPPVASSAVTSNGTLYGDMANYTCQTGYIYLSGNTTLTCGATGKWEGSLVSCQKISCGPPPPVASSAVTSNGTLYGDMANYTCQTGYIYLSGNTTLTCGATGKWEGSLVSCQKISCGPPPPVASSAVTSNGTSYGDMANYTCQTGYIYLSGDTTLTCGATGKWEGSLISCQKVSCGSPPPIANSAVTSNGKSYGDMANYTCQTGYIYLSGDMTLTCGATGNWEGYFISCQKVSCGPPPAIANSVVTSNRTSYGDMANYTCQTGCIYISGDTTLTCGSSGTWLGRPLLCQKKDCGPPEILNSSLVSFTSTTYSSQAVYSCITGYERDQGDLKRICQYNGTWSGTPLICTRMVCAQAPVFEGARPCNFQGEGHNEYQDKCLYECYYEQEGREGLHWVLECGANKEWVGEKPQCGGNSPHKTPNSSHDTLEAPAAWAIGVVIFAILATLIILFVVLDCRALRKHSKYIRRNVRDFRKNLAHSLSRFRVWVKWKPTVVRRGKMVLAPPTGKIPDLSPTPSVRSIIDLQDSKKASDLNEANFTYLNVSGSRWQLTPPSSTLITPRNSVSDLKFTLVTPRNSFSEPKSSLVTPRNSVSESKSALVTPRNSVSEPKSTLVTPRNSFSEPKSPSAIKLSTTPEPPNQSTLPNVDS